MYNNGWEVYSTLDIYELTKSASKELNTIIKYIDELKTHAIIKADTPLLDALESLRSKAAIAGCMISDRRDEAKRKLNSVDVVGNINE